MSLDIMAAKLVFAFVFIIFLMWIVRPAISIIGIITCPNCNPFINAILFVVVPVGAVFIGLYKIVTIFTARGN